MDAIVQRTQRNFDKTETGKVKGIAICLLLFHHLFYSQARVDAGGVVFRWLPQSLVMSLATGARVCVPIFVFLSAYGLTVQYGKLGDAPSRRDRLIFMKKHWLSLMKPYWFIYILN